MRIKIIGGETLGTRSLSSFIECSDLRILIDPGVALGPRFNLLPHPIEYENLMRTRREIESHASESDVVFISHYHYDHFTPFWKEIDNLWTFADVNSAEKIYKHKQVFIKDPFNNINESQRSRAKEVLPHLNKIAKEIRIADSREYKIGNTKLIFSNPLPHGEDNTPLGKVLMLCIEDKGEKFLFASDVEGPISEKVFEEIVRMKPNCMLISGPPLYLLGTKLSYDNFQKAIDNLSKLLKHVDVIILDHHFLRSHESLNYIKKLKEIADGYGSMLMTIAEFNNMELKLLEACRKELYKDKPPSEEFIEWTRKKSGFPPISYKK